MALPEPGPGRTVVVTGAGSGIGEQLARRLTDLGHATTLVGRDAAPLETLAAELRRTAGTSVDVHALDLGDDAARSGLVEAITAGDRDVAGLCNVAALRSEGRLVDLPLAGELELVRVNVVALHHLTAAVLPGMLRRGTGAVLNVASASPFHPAPRQATYAATKAFVQSFSAALHTELSGTGVSVTTLGADPSDVEDDGLGDAEQAVAAVRAMATGRRAVAPGIGAKALAAGGRVIGPAARLIARD